MDLIPLDSIRVGYGPFITETRGRGELHHACMQYASPASSNLNFKDQAYKDLFHRRFPHCVSDLEVPPYSTAHRPLQGTQLRTAAYKEHDACLCMDPLLLWIAALRCPRFSTRRAFSELTRGCVRGRRR
eukprot:3719148-Rhodomonas_salina.2